MSLLPAEELLRAAQGRPPCTNERPEAGLEAGDWLRPRMSPEPTSSGALPYRGLLPPLCPPALPMLPVPEDGESRLTCRASVPWGLPNKDGHLPESGVPGELALLLALAANSLGGETPLSAQSSGL